MQAEKPEGMGHRRVARVGAYVPCVLSWFCALWPAPPAVFGDVDLDLRPLGQTVRADEIVSITLHAVADGGMNEPVGQIRAVVTWPAETLELIGVDNSGTHNWFLFGLLDDSIGDNLNGDLSDGDALFQATAFFTDLAEATPAGLLVATFRFRPRGTITNGLVEIVPQVGGTMTQVLDDAPPLGVDVTGLLGASLVTVTCDADGQCEDGNPCTDGFCVSQECGFVPNDQNDPDDGIFCNGVEDSCSNGEIIYSIPPPDCDDQLTCTLDTCSEAQASCVNAIRSGFCLIGGQCFSTFEWNPLNDCEHCDPSLDAQGWSFRGQGVACGDQTSTDCDEPDRCDGAGFCDPLFKPDGTDCTSDQNSCTDDFCDGGVCVHIALPAGTPCGSSATTPCTDPDACDANGICQPNNLPDDTPCDDDRFCTTVSSCRLGICAGLGSPCPNIVCDERTDKCKGTSLAIEPADQTVMVGETVRLSLILASTVGEDLMIGSLGAILAWSPARLNLLGHVDDGPYLWAVSSFPNDCALDGLNAPCTGLPANDGTALYVAIGQLPGSGDPAFATVDGLLVTTFEFEATASGVTFVSIPEVIALTLTQVIDGESAGLDILTSIAQPAVVRVIECVNDAECDDGIACSDDRCLNGLCLNDPIHSACDDGLFCTGVETCSLSNGCVTTGDPCGNPAACVEETDSCLGCTEPTVFATGSRYVTVEPPSLAQPVAFIVRGNPGTGAVECVGKYVQANGSLGPDPVFQEPQQWGTIDITGADILPDYIYRVQTDCGQVGQPVFSAPRQAQTWADGDLNDSGDSDVDDLLLILNAFSGNFETAPLTTADMLPCSPDRAVDVDDILAVIRAFAGIPLGCDVPCDPGACCLSALDCVDGTSIEECLALGGVHAGPATNCAEDACAFIPATSAWGIAALGLALALIGAWRVRACSGAPPVS